MILHYLQQSLDFFVNESLGGWTDWFVFISVSYWTNLIRNSRGERGREVRGERGREREREIKIRGRSENLLPCLSSQSG